MRRGIHISLSTVITLNLCQSIQISNQKTSTIRQNNKQNDF